MNTFDQTNSRSVEAADQAGLNAILSVEESCLDQENGFDGEIQVCGIIHDIPAVLDIIFILLRELLRSIQVS